MAAQVQRQDAEVGRQRLEDAAVGEGVEAVGVQENKIDGPTVRAEVE